MPGWGLGGSCLDTAELSVHDAGKWYARCFTKVMNTHLSEELL